MKRLFFAGGVILTLVLCAVGCRPRTQITPEEFGTIVTQMPEPEQVPNVEEFPSSLPLPEGADVDCKIQKDVQTIRHTKQNY